MNAPAAAPAAPLLPASLVADADAGRPVRFRHPRTGAELRFLPAPPTGNGEGSTEVPDEVWRRIQIEVDGGEISELEALRRAVAENMADEAAGIEPQPIEEMWAEIEREFPRLRGIAARAGIGAPE